MSNQPLLSPASIYLRKAEYINANLGHENLGHLSRAYGVMPLEEPLAYFAESHSQWDNLAYQIPKLYKQQQLRNAFDKMSILEADAKNLPEKYVLRAAHILCFFAHAYIRCEHPRLERQALPKSIEHPWQQISRRLQRKKPFMSFRDLISYNWQYKAKDNEVRTIDNMQLLTPIFDNQEENMLFLTQIGMMAAATPLINDMCHAHDAAVNEDIDGLIEILERLSMCIREITYIFQKHIDPIKLRATTMHPIVFSKTIMSFPVPIEEGVPGPSGAAYIPFHIFDEFIQRKQYNNFLDKEVQFIRSWLSPHHRAFMAALQKVSIIDFVKKKNYAPLTRAYEKMIETYAGDYGFLGIHQRRIYSFIQTAFKAGRDETVGGYMGELTDSRWITINNELQSSRYERLDDKQIPKSCPFSRLRKKATNKAAPTKEFLYSYVANCNNSDNGFLLIYNDNVYDITQYLSEHPGGNEVLEDHAGRDATKEIQIAHEKLPKAYQVMERYKVGVMIKHHNFSTFRNHIFNIMRSFLFEIVEIQNTFRLEYESAQNTCFNQDKPKSYYPFKAKWLASTHHRFIITHLPSVSKYIQSLAHQLPLAVGDEKIFLPRHTIESSLVYVETDAALMQAHKDFMLLLFAKDLSLIAELKVSAVAMMSYIENHLSDDARLQTELSFFVVQFAKIIKDAIAGIIVTKNLIDNVKAKKVLR